VEYHICVSQCANHLEVWSLCGCSSSRPWLMNNIVDTGMVYYRASVTDVTL